MPKFDHLLRPVYRLLLPILLCSVALAAGPASGNVTFRNFSSSEQMSSYESSPKTTEPTHTIDLDVRSAVALWYPRKKAVRVLLFPTVLKKSEVDSLLEDVRQAKELPDLLARVRSRHDPSAIVYLNFKGNAKRYTSQALERYGIAATRTGLPRLSEQFYFNYAPTKGEKGIKGFSMTGSPKASHAKGDRAGNLKFAVRGHQVCHGSVFWHYDWDLRVNAQLYYGEEK